MPDLSSPDLWILPIMAGITQFFSFVVTQAQTKDQQGNAAQMAGMMKMMKYFMPMMIVWMGRSFPSGMAVYWVIGNLFTIVQTLGLRGWKNKLLKMKSEGKDKPSPKKTK
jgi:YidC/Oxa1 family membrane protein insertase